MTPNGDSESDRGFQAADDSFVPPGSDDEPVDAPPPLEADDDDDEVTHVRPAARLPVRRDKRATRMAMARAAEEAAANEEFHKAQAFRHLRRLIFVLIAATRLGSAVTLQQCDRGGPFRTQMAIDALRARDTAWVNSDAEALAEWTYLPPEQEERFNDGREDQEEWRERFPPPNGLEGRELYRYWVSAERLDDFSLRDVNPDRANYRVTYDGQDQIQIEAQDEHGVYCVDRRYQDGHWRHSGEWGVRDR